MKLVKSVLVVMLLGIMAIQMAWAEEMTQAEREERERLRMEFLKLLDAAERGNLDDVKLHLSRGADVNGKSSKHGETALMIASSDGKLEIVKYLISKGADINATDKYGRNALMKHLGGYPEDLEIVKALVGGNGGFLSLFKESNGVDVNAKDNKGKTALMYARSLEVIKYLLSKGADINAKDNEGKSVFDYTKSGEIAEFLLSKGAKR